MKAKTKIKKLVTSAVNNTIPFYYDKKELSYKRMNGWLIVVIFLFSCSTFFLGWKLSEKNEISNMKKFEEEEKLVIVKNGDKFNEEKLILFINELNFKWPEVVYAQAVLESGSEYNSDINIENNNYFGMKLASVRLNTQVGENLNHAVFNNWRMSVIDYALYWASYLSDLKTKEEYYQYIEKHYSETPGYSLRVMNLEKQYFEKLSKIKSKDSYNIFETDSLNSKSPIKKINKKINSKDSTNTEFIDKKDSTKTF